mmetsp:Transcript_32191/g.106416  ORF Transcript_32191/g.106416 Transcript_32191/m.106416 type:complete len:234 (+) Transcript_32191:1290-1991(+)
MAPRVSACSACMQRSVTVLANIGQYPLTFCATFFRRAPPVPAPGDDEGELPRMRASKSDSGGSSSPSMARRRRARLSEEESRKRSSSSRRSASINCLNNSARINSSHGPLGICSLANSTGTLPCAVGSMASARRPSKSCTKEAWPEEAAKCSDVLPAWLMWSTAARWLSNKEHTSTCPAREALCRAAKPQGSCTSTSAPRSSASLALSAEPSRAASYKCCLMTLSPPEGVATA